MVKITVFECHIVSDTFLMLCIIDSQPFCVPLPNCLSQFIWVFFLWYESIAFKETRRSMSPIPTGRVDASFFLTGIHLVAIKLNKLSIRELANWFASWVTELIKELPEDFKLHSFNSVSLPM